MKNFSFDEILARLRGKEVVSSRTACLPHLSWEEIFEYLEHRYELPPDNPLKRRVLNHIIECRQCHSAFSYAHDLTIALETGSIPESTEESKQKAYEIALHTYQPEGETPEVSEIDRERKAGGANWRTLDEIIEFPALRTATKIEKLEDEVSRKAAKSKDEYTFKYGDTQLLSGNKGVMYTDTSSGHFCVQLSEPPERITGVRVALCERKPDGSWEVRLEEKTNESGIADFGRIDDIPKPQHESVYTLRVVESSEGLDSEH